MAQSRSRTLSDTEKRRIAGRARTLQERLDEPSPEAFPEQRDDVDRWVDEWRDRLGVDYFDNFEERLSRAGRTLGACRHRLEATGWPADRPLPEWIDEVEQLLAFVQQSEPDPIPEEIPDREQEPFVHFLDVIAEYAVGRVDWGGANHRLDPAAIESLRSWLVRRIGGICAHSLFIEFKTYIGHHDRELALADDPETPEDPRSYYRAFISQLFQGGFKNFLLEYSFLARLLVTTIRQWVGAVESFASRLASDWAALEQFTSQDTLEAVVDIEPRGDPHQRGQVVFALDFDSGERVAYKPRSIAIEAAFFDFLAWVNETSDRPNLRTVDCLTRDAYGWMEWVDTHECESLAQAKSYYRRAGMLLCILYVLRFTDGHLENVLASRDQPVIVDLETIAEPAGNHANTIENKIHQLYNDSVLRKGFLPMHQPDSRLDGWNGFASASAKETGIEVPAFKRPNTDLMELEFEDSRTFHGENLPVYDGEVVPPEEHSDEIIEGFRAVYDEFLDQKSELLADDGPLACFDGVEIRYLNRSTHVYSAILASLTMPEYLRTGLKIGCKLESFSRSFLHDGGDGEMWPVFEAERAALTRLDVPRLTTTTDGTDLEWDDCLVADCFEETPLSQIRDRVAQLSTADRREQTDYIRLGYHEHGLLDPETGTEPIDRPVVTDATDVATETPREIFDRLTEAEQRTSDGELTWHLREHRQGGIFLHKIEDHLYSGRTGVAMFCAALADTFDAERYGEYARSILAPTVDDIENERLSFDTLGVADGLGSVIYGLTTTGDLLDDRRYVDAARTVAGTLSSDRIYEDSNYDVFTGSAGIILALLALYRRTGDTDLLDVAETAGYHVLSNRQSVDGGYGWPDEQGQALAGFAHGAAGIAFALDKLGRVADVSEFRDVAHQSIVSEDHHYDETEQNWADVRSVTDAEFMDGWCNGRTGIGLARLGMDTDSGAECVRRDVDRALDGLETGRLAAQDHLCCGNASRIEFLLRAGRTFEESEYVDQARRIARATVSRAEERERFAGRWQTEHWYNPGFFTGETGIGYSLLRLENPDLPSVLLFE